MNTEIAQKEITISGQPFNVSQPYIVGHVVTEAEAKALNQVRAENIRNNMATRVKAAYATEGRKEDDPTPETIGALVAEYDGSYEFTMASVGGGKRPTDPVEIEAIKIAREAFAAHCASKGFTVKAARAKLGEDVYTEKLAEIALRDNILKEAKRRVKARQEQASAALDDMDLGDIADAPVEETAAAE